MKWDFRYSYNTHVPGGLFLNEVVRTSSEKTTRGNKGVAEEKKEKKKNSKSKRSRRELEWRGVKKGRRGKNIRTGPSIIPMKDYSLTKSTHLQATEHPPGLGD